MVARKNDWRLMVGMHLDIGTLLVTAAVASGFSTAARLVLWRLHPSMPGLLQWVLASLTTAVSLGLIAAPSGPLALWSASLSPLAMVASHVLVWDGMSRFTGRGPLPRRTVAGWMGAGLLAVLLVDETVMLRNAVIALLASGIGALIGRELLTAAGRGQIAMRITGWVFLLNAGFFLLRAVHHFRTPSSPLEEITQRFAGVGLMWWLCMTLAFTLCMVLMTGERLQNDVNRQMTRLDEVTAQKLAEERLRLAEKELLAQSLRQWMTDTSHELRTPIAVLRAQIEAFQDGVHAVDARRLDLLHGQVMGLSRLVDDLHTLARSDVGQLECRAQPTLVLDLVNDLVGIFRGRFGAAGLEIEWQGSGSGGPPVMADPGHLRQMLSNLFENALRYTDPGGRLRISWEVTPGALALYFDDTAPGVPVELLPRLFERFFRVDASRSRERGGTGIGLAVTRSLVEINGGSIEAAPSPLGGLRVSLVLPVG